MRARLSHFFQLLWFGSSRVSVLLLPFSGVVRTLVWLKRMWFLCFPPEKKHVPVVVVGNLTVGGVGKTPLLIHLVKTLVSRGLKVGVVSRGYGAQQCSAWPFPRFVALDQPVSNFGDEPAMIARSCGVPVVIDPQRVNALEALLQRYPTLDLVVSDDGLQHYQLPRDFEIVVTDARGWGNGFLLPAGPLREPLSRLGSVQHLVVNSMSHDRPKVVGETLPVSYMQVVPEGVYRVVDDSLVADWQTLLPGAPKIQAVAGIGHPQRFFATLIQMGLKFEQHIFPDHHAYSDADFEVLDHQAVILVTEKDAVKLRSMDLPQLWYLKISINLFPDDVLLNELLALKVRK